MGDGSRVHSVSASPAGEEVPLEQILALGSGGSRGHRAQSCPDGRSVLWVWGLSTAARVRGLGGFHTCCTMPVAWMWGSDAPGASGIFQTLAGGEGMGHG